MHCNSGPLVTMGERSLHPCELEWRLVVQAAEEKAANAAAAKAAEEKAAEDEAAKVATSL